jgi:hypothetical protein
MEETAKTRSVLKFCHMCFYSMVLLKTLTKLMGFKVVVSFARNLGSPQLYMCNSELSEPLWTKIKKV